MSSEIAIAVDGVCKCYEIYDTPRDRLKQFVLPHLKTLIGRQPKNHYREFWALKEVSFEVKRGETMGIVGRNGSGKSTLLQLICGTLSPSGGTIRANGRVAALLELGSGFNPEFTGRENVYLNGAILGLTKDEIDSRYDQIASFADIGEFIERPVKTYSSGMVVRLAFSVAISADPDTLIIDEALSVGDELFQRKCFSRIESMRSRGTTILFVSHSASSVIDLCDRALLLDSGRLITIGNPKTVIGHYQKLLYTPHDRLDQVRAKIPPTDNAAAQSIATLNSDAKHFLQSEPSFNMTETYDSGFTTTSFLDFEAHGARISNAQIFTTDGRQVNGLIRGRVYNFRYIVQFEHTRNNVRFAMLVKTASGMPLGGALSAPSTATAIPIANAGHQYVVEYSFHCHLNPGVYFLNAGVFGTDDSGEETLLHRQADVLVFRVLPVPDCRETEIVDLNFACKWHIHGQDL